VGQVVGQVGVSVSGRAVQHAIILARASGETGRRAGLRIQWGNPWEFKSPLAHHNHTAHLRDALSDARLIITIVVPRFVPLHLPERPPSAA
jgi:hypothetical protein